MSILARMAFVIILLALAALGAAYSGTAHARAVRGVHGHHAAHHGHLGLPFGYQPQQPMTPQFNEPGPKLWVPQPGNAVEQLSPLMVAGQPDALGIR
jgi:hypothetical protein